MDRKRAQALLLRQRASYQKLFDMQGEMINSLRDVLSAVAATQEEMARVFGAANDLDDVVSDDAEGA